MCTADDHQRSRIQSACNYPVFSNIAQVVSAVATDLPRQRNNSMETDFSPLHKNTIGQEGSRNSNTSNNSSMHQPTLLTHLEHATVSGENSCEEENSRGIETRTRKRLRRSGISGRESLPKRHHRIFVQHNYHDHSRDVGESDVVPVRSQSKNPPPFPSLLHTLLEQADYHGYNDIISWQPHGRAFHVHDQARFIAEVMPKFFRQTRYSSFQRQLSLYGFLRLVQKGPDHSAYYHELFLRGLPHLVDQMHRTRVKGYMVRQSSSPETEPDFSKMPPVGNSEEFKPAASIANHQSRNEGARPAGTQWALPTSGMAFASLEHHTRLPDRLPTSDLKLPPMPPLRPTQPNLGLNVNYLTQPASGLEELGTSAPDAAGETMDPEREPVATPKNAASVAGMFLPQAGQEDLASFLCDVDLSEEEGDEDFAQEKELEKIFENPEHSEESFE